MIMSCVRIVYKLKEFPIDLDLASHSVKLEDTWRVREMLLSLLNLADVFISHVLTKLRLGFGSWLVIVNLFAIHTCEPSRIIREPPGNAAQLPHSRE